TRMLGQDAFNWFQTHGGLTRENGQRFRDMVLSRGNTEDYAAMYRAFAGHDPSIQPYIDYYGLPNVSAPAAAPAPAPAPAPANPTERGR
ncbi:MAG: M3 family metallopeptidase, partial [Sphingomicrobium sp.]